MSIHSKQRKSTAVITDIRNFSKTFKEFQNNESDNFLHFIEEYYMMENNLARIISDEVHMSSTGDGIVAIFLDDETHHKDGFAYILATHRLLNQLCNKFMEENPGSFISFGIGSDSGNVWKVGTGFLRTYVGTVINRAARIEEMTKIFANTTTAVGNSVYKYLMKEFYPSTYEVIQSNIDAGGDYDSILNTNPDTVLASNRFALQYVFDMPLKGIQGDAPIFRVSESLVWDDDLYWSVMKMLLGEKSLIIKKMFNGEV